MTDPRAVHRDAPYTFPPSETRPSPLYSGPERRRNDRADLPLANGGVRITVDLTAAGARRLLHIMERGHLTRTAALDAAIEAYATEDPDTQFSQFSRL